MTDNKALIKTHLEREGEARETEAVETYTSVDTFAGKIQVKWAPEGAVSALGLMPFFIEFPKTSGPFEAWVKECPLRYTSPNAPAKRDVLGTIMLSVLAGHWRYAHISAIREDGVNPGLLGMTKVVSEDSARRARRGMAEAASESELRTAVGRAVGIGYGHDRETFVRSPTGCRARLQPGQTGAPLARLSHFVHRQSAHGAGRGGSGGKSDGLVVCPASQAKQEFKDREIFEEFLELLATLRSQGFDRTAVFVTPNGKDYGPPPNGHPKIASDLAAGNAQYAANVSWARDMMSRGNS